MKTDIKKKFFSRHDDLKKEDSIKQSAIDFLLWIANEEEKKGNTEVAKRLREQAGPPKE